MNKKIEYYKKLYGDGEVKLLPNHRMEVPTWLVALLINKSGLKSRKKRLLKKRLKREIHKAIERGLTN